MSFSKELLAIFSNFSFIDLLDILLVAFVVYKVIKLFQDSRVMQLLKGLFILLIFYGVSTLIDLNTMSFLIRSILQYGAIAFIVVLTPEIRSTLEKIGTISFMDFSSLFENESNDEVEQLALASSINIIVDSCGELSESKTGALIVFERKSNLGDIIRTGTILDAEPSKELIGNIFFVNTPLHDGAVVVRDGKIYAAGCYLPLSSNMEINKKYGTRHRAGLGLSETCDAVSIIISEERGTISAAIGGKLSDELTKDDLHKILEKLLLKNKKKKRYSI